MDNDSNGGATEVVKIGITFERFWDVARSTWHILFLLGYLFWQTASYKSALDSHLRDIDQHMIVEDNKLNWLISHHWDSKDVPEVVPQKTAKPKPQLYDQTRHVALELPPQEVQPMPLPRTEP